MGSLALAAVFLGASTLLEGAALAKAVALAGALFRALLEGLGLAVHCHGVSGVNYFSTLSHRSTNLKGPG